MTPSPPISRGAGRPAQKGPSQRQLRAGELVRHALVEILREEELDDPALYGVPATITAARVRPALSPATCLLPPLGRETAAEVTAAMSRASRFLRGKLGRMIDLRVTPDLKFRHDEAFDAAEKMNRLFDDPKVRQDLDRPDGDAPDSGDED